MHCRIAFGLLRIALIQIHKVFEVIELMRFGAASHDRVRACSLAQRHVRWFAVCYKALLHQNPKLSRIPWFPRQLPGCISLQKCTLVPRRQGLPST